MNGIINSSRSIAVSVHLLRVEIQNNSQVKTAYFSNVQLCMIIYFFEYIYNVFICPVQTMIHYHNISILHLSRVEFYCNDLPNPYCELFNVNYSDGLAVCCLYVPIHILIPLYKDFFLFSCAKISELIINKNSK